VAEPLAGRAAVVAAAGDHPYARLTTGDGTGVSGVRDGSTVVWLTPGPAVCALGDASVALEHVAALAGAGAHWWHLPRLPADTPLPWVGVGEAITGPACEHPASPAQARILAAKPDPITEDPASSAHMLIRASTADPGREHPASPARARVRGAVGDPAREQPASPAWVRVRDDWDFRWTSAAPPVRDGEERAAPIRDDRAVEALLDAAFPETTSRPGDPRVRGWWGIRAGSRLVACAADRSRGGVGFLAAVAVDPAARGHGLGTALTAALTRHLIGEHGVCALGVMTHNIAAARLYESLGYASSLPRTSLGLL